MTTYTATRTRKHFGTVTFTWTGGMYVDVAFNGQNLDVINVLDRDSNNPIKTRADFNAEVRDYMADGAALVDYFCEAAANTANYSATEAEAWLARHPKTA